MSKKVWLLPPMLACAALAAGGGLSGARAAVAAPAVRRVATLAVPGRPLASFDIGTVDSRGVYALSDRSNQGLDFFDAATGRAVRCKRRYRSGAPVENPGPEKLYTQP